MARIADDLDFAQLKTLVDENDGWSLELTKGYIDVWTKPVGGCSFHMVKIHTKFDNITPDILFDVIHDPDYRRIWDSHMLASEEIGVINVNNDIGYYAMNCPTPLKPRDFVLMRSWLDTGPGGEAMLISKSVEHRDYPPKKGFIRATSHLTGFVMRPHGQNSCVLSYVTHCDPQGALPPWLVNKVTHTFGPRMIKDLQKAAVNYLPWKSERNLYWKPWRFPEQIDKPRISIEECLPVPLPSAPDATSTTATQLGQMNKKANNNNNNNSPARRQLPSLISTPQRKKEPSPSSAQQQQRQLEKETTTQQEMVVGGGGEKLKKKKSRFF